MRLLKIATPFLINWNCSHLEMTLMPLLEMFIFLSAKPFKLKRNNLYFQGQD